jgi:ribose-phosphate pyrophosphokinase
VTRVVIQTLRSGSGDAERLASRLGLAAYEIAIHAFPDGELRVAVAPTAPVTIIYAPLDQPNDKLFAILFAAEALRRNGAKRLILVAPYMCYMRQDAAFRPGEAISQKVIGRLLADAFNRIVTVDAHLHRTKNIQNVFPGIEADNLSAMPAIADALRAIGVDPGTVVVGPDEESRRWVGDLADRLGLAHTVAKKERRGDRSVDIALADPNLIAGRPVLLVDDIVSSGGTLIACAKKLASAGAAAIDAIITHALFPAELTGAFTRAGIRSVRSTHSVPHPTNAIALDDILTAALRDEIGDTCSREATS